MKKEEIFKRISLAENESFDIGETVICDSCDEDYTDSDLEGGLLFGSYAYCPKCSPGLVTRAKEYGEIGHIKAICPEGMSFRQWVLGLRGGDNTITVKTFKKNG